MQARKHVNISCTRALAHANVVKPIHSSDSCQNNNVHEEILKLFLEQKKAGTLLQLHIRWGATLYTQNSCAFLVPVS